MDFKKVCEIGLKVLVVVGSGIAVYLSVKDQHIEKEETVPTPKKENNEKSGEVVSNKFVSGLSDVTNTFGKLMTVTQSITSLAENCRTLFGKQPIRPQYAYNSYWGNPCVCGGGMGMVGEWDGNKRRLSPFITEIAPTTRVNYGNQYPV